MPAGLSFLKYLWGQHVSPAVAIQALGADSWTTLGSVFLGGRMLKIELNQMEDEGALC